MSARQKPKLREFIVSTRETRSFDVEYTVQAHNENEARGIISSMEVSESVTDVITLLNSVNDVEIRSVKENV